MKADRLRGLVETVHELVQSHGDIRVKRIIVDCDNYKVEDVYGNTYIVEESIMI